MRSGFGGFSEITVTGVLDGHVAIGWLRLAYDFYVNELAYDMLMCCYRLYRLFVYKVEGSLQFELELVKGQTALRQIRQ